MIYRAATKQILDDLTFFPVVAIVGPRQAGKTTLAQNLRILSTSLHKPSRAI